MAASSIKDTAMAKTPARALPQTVIAAQAAVFVIPAQAAVLVIPAQAGIQHFFLRLDSRLRGND